MENISADAFWLKISIQEEAFNLGNEELMIRENAGDVGALVAFQGMVRTFNSSNSSDNNPIIALKLEHYPEVTENEMRQIVNTAATRWALNAVRVIHRVGKLHANEVIVLVITCAKHRKEAFDAAEFIMDYLKTKAPFWKQEIFANGQSQWVEAKSSDQDAAQHW